MPFFFFLLSRSGVGASSPGLFDGDDDSGLVKDGLAISISSGDFPLNGLAVGSS
jgi:hypothetical protein